MERKNFLFYRDWWDIIECMPTVEQKFAIVECLARYAFFDEKPADLNLSVIAGLMLKAIERDNEKYDKRCEQNRRNAAKRQKKAIESERNRTLANDADIDNDIDIDKEIDKDIDIEKEKEIEKDKELIDKSIKIDKSMINNINIDKEISFLKKQPAFIEAILKNYELDGSLLDEEFGEFKEACLIQGNDGHRDMAEARRHFCNWMALRRGIHAMKRSRRAAGNLGCDERIDTRGRRTYGSGMVEVPLTAPPRPGLTWAWSKEKGEWTANC